MAFDALVVLFLFVALLHSMCGFGGGSSYIALMVVFAVPFTHVPALALACNIIVASTAAVNLVRSGHFSLSLTLPFVAASVPMAYLAGRTRVGERAMLTVLGLSLAFAGLRMIIPQRRDSSDAQRVRPAMLWTAGAAIGAALGGLAGLVGIGGGIFLAPALHFLRWGKPKQIAATASVFIVVNSLSGLAGQMRKLGPAEFAGHDVVLFAAVAVGGLAGARLCSTRLSQVGVLAASARMLVRAAAGV
jgi:uncharacterized membrane protein YfcA